MRSHPYIAIEGPIGVGKTTLARLLQPEFDSQLLLEVFEENPFLSDFYQDRARYAFQTQVFFLLSRYRQQHEAVPRKLHRGPLISDYTFTKDRLFAHLNLQGDELEMYNRVHEILAEKIPLPDLVVYLRADTDVLMERIAFRDRPYERDMDPDYIEALNRAYEGFFAAYIDAPVLPIDTNELNIVREIEDLELVERRVRSASKTGTYQEPLPEMEPTEHAELPELQRWHKTLDEEKGVETDPYISFILLQGELGELAREITQVWKATRGLRDAGLDWERAQELALDERSPGLEEELADCLAYLLRVANYTGIDLQKAYLEKMQINQERNWRE